MEKEVSATPIALLFKRIKLGELQRTPKGGLAIQACPCAPAAELATYRKLKSVAGPKCLGDPCMMAAWVVVEAA